MSKAKHPIQKPGEKARDSGQFGLVDSKGRGLDIEITATKGKRLPPTPEPDQGYVLVDKTRHKGGK